MSLYIALCFGENCTKHYIYWLSFVFFCFAVSIQKSIIDFKSKLCWMNCDSLVNGVRTMINYIYRRGRVREIEIELHWKARNTLVLRQILNSKTTLILGQRE